MTHKEFIQLCRSGALKCKCDNEECHGFTNKIATYSLLGAYNAMNIEDPISLDRLRKISDLFLPHSIIAILLYYEI